jgi:uncharacterized protein with PIN domain
VVKFFCDVNVFRLAKWLRFAGFDTMTRRELSKDKIAQICKKDRRILLTRDKKWSSVPKVEIIISENYLDQLEQILAKYHLRDELISTRCIDCNVLLKNTTLHAPHLKYCPRCGKKYWQGTHYQNMLDKIKPFQFSLK